MHHYLLHFAWHWYHTRRRIDLLSAAPAIALMVLSMVVGLEGASYSRDDKVRHYRAATLDALDAGQLATAELLFRKLRHLGPPEADVAFRLAVALEESHGARATWDRLAEIAPVDAAGYGPAHSWLAESIIQQKVTVLKGEADQIAERHLLHAVTTQPERLKPKQDLGLHYFRTQQWEQAATVLGATVSSEPDLRLLRARALAKTGRLDEAQQEARTFTRIYHELLETGAAFEPVHFVRWAAGHQLLGGLNAAEAVLQQGLERYPDDASLRVALARVYFLQSDAVRLKGPNQLAPQLEALEKALSANPRDLAVLGRLAELSSNQGVQAKRAERVLHQVLTSGSAPALVHTILGTIAAGRGDKQTARLHLEQARRQDPSSAAALNNLAWVLVQSDEPDLDRALRLAEQAVAIEPEMPEFRETRGQVLIRLERWAEAITDLEFALRQLTESSSIHHALARAYAALGHSRLADLHRQAATRNPAADDAI